jgi:hypothetical protein
MSLPQETRDAFAFATDESSSIKLKAAFGFLVATCALVPTAIVAAQWITRGAGPEPQTSAWSIVPGALIVLWGITVAMRRERVVVDTKARTLAWVTTAFGFPYRVTTWPWGEVRDLQVVVNNSLRSAGRRADACGPQRRRTVFHYFHSSPPQEVVQLAKLLGVPLIDQRERHARQQREHPKSD